MELRKQLVKTFLQKFLMGKYKIFNWSERADYLDSFVKTIPINTKAIPLNIILPTTLTIEVFLIFCHFSTNCPVLIYVRKLD